MKTQFDKLIESISHCSVCAFRDCIIEPLAPLPVNPPVPILFIGENPSWAKNQDVPFAVKTHSGQALDNYYLKPLNLTRQQVWITDLFKCRYPKDIYRAKAKENEKIQAVAETCAKLWLVQEIEIAQPKVIVTLSDQQVYQRLRHAFDLPTPAKFELAVGKPRRITLAGLSTWLFPMIHPDISSPVGVDHNRKIRTREKWAVLHQEMHIPALKILLEAGNSGWNLS
jgi:uracil-DNA glycosylase family 4